MIGNAAELKALQRILNQDITLHLYSNDVTPAESDGAGSYTEVTGGGYAAKTLNYAGWTITAGSPTRAVYAAQDFNFTGPTTGPGTIYGYYLLDADGDLMGSIRFSEAVVPFTPINGSLIRIIPKYAGE